jgi:hypothetical protein
MRCAPHAISYRLQSTFHSAQLGISAWGGRSIILLSTLFLIFLFLLVFLLLPITLLSLEFLLPELVGGFFV